MAENGVAKYFLAHIRYKQLYFMGMAYAMLGIGRVQQDDDEGVAYGIRNLMTATDMFDKAGIAAKAFVDAARTFVFIDNVTIMTALHATSRSPAAKTPARSAFDPFSIDSMTTVLATASSFRFRPSGRLSVAVTHSVGVGVGVGAGEPVLARPLLRVRHRHSHRARFRRSESARPITPCALHRCWSVTTTSCPTATRSTRQATPLWPPTVRRASATARTSHSDAQ